MFYAVSPNSKLPPAATNTLWAAGKVVESKEPVVNGVEGDDGEAVLQTTNYFIRLEIPGERVLVKSLVHSPFRFASRKPRAFHVHL